MLENRSQYDAPSCGGAIRHGGVCDKFAVVLLLLMLMRIDHALAGEQFSMPGASVKPNIVPTAPPLPTAPSMFDLPPTYQLSGTTAANAFSPNDFRPRGHSVLETPPQPPTSDNVPMLHGTTIWQRLEDYRSQGRVRLLTLWETGGSSVSLQAGRKGAPSLQWTSRSLNRGGATRGVFDQLASSSIARATRPHPNPSASPGEPAARNSKVSDVAATGANK